MVGATVGGSATVMVEIGVGVGDGVAVTTITLCPKQPVRAVKHKVNPNVRRNRLIIDVIFFRAQGLFRLGARRKKGLSRKKY